MSHRRADPIRSTPSRCGEGQRRSKQAEQRRGRRVRVARARAVHGGRARGDGDVARRRRCRPLRAARCGARSRRRTTAGRAAMRATRRARSTAAARSTSRCSARRRAPSRSHVEYIDARTSRDPTCLDGEMPRDAVLVKADWRRKLAGENLPIFDTSRRAHARAARAATPTGRRRRQRESRPVVDLHGDAAERQRVPHARAPHHDEGARPLAVDHAVVVADPDTDFGADRPAAIAALPGPWRNYKMCVATSYVEGDPDPRGGPAARSAMRSRRCTAASARRRGAAIPYLELGAGNAATNCIGCHQHGGTDADARGDPRDAAAPRHDARAEQLLHRLPVGDQRRAGRGPVGARAGRGRLLGRDDP